MTIEWGGAWGEPGMRPPEAPVAGSDRELAALAHQAHQQGRRLLAGISGGDVLRTIGVVGERPLDEQHQYPFDLGYVTLDGADPVPFVAHVIAHRPLGAGELVAVMNVGWRGLWYLGPKAHPNDGLLDITIGTLSPRQRLLARSRVGTGSHLPHPDLKALRRARWTHTLARPTRVWVDGRSMGRHRSIEVSLIPTCFIVGV